MKEDFTYVLIFIVGMISMVMYSSANNAIPLAPKEVPQVIDSTSTETVSIDRATIYNAVVKQCDADPLTTADGSHIDLEKLKNRELQWVALSQDLVKDEYKAKLHKGLFQGKFRFGDSIIVTSIKHKRMNGIYVVHDVMNSRYKRSLDFLVASQYNHEFNYGDDFKISKK